MLNNKIIRRHGSHHHLPHLQYMGLVSKKSSSPTSSSSSLSNTHIHTDSPLSENHFVDLNHINNKSYPLCPHA